jgi:hypothetical protein
MHIPSDTLRRALLRVFAGCGADAGQRLAFAEIERGWRGTGFRGSDLRDAVHEMLERGELRCAQEQEVLGFALAPTAAAGLARVAQDDPLLLRAGMRARNGAAWGRRASDQGV